MTPQADTTTSSWVQITTSAFGLVLAGRVVVLVYWQGGRAGSSEPGFSWLPTERPAEPVQLFVAINPTVRDWARARALAERAHARDVRDDPERREAAELLRRSPWWQRELLREELLSRRWYGPQRGQGS